MFCTFIESFNRRFITGFVKNRRVSLDPVIYWKNDFKRSSVSSNSITLARNNQKKYYK